MINAGRKNITKNIGCENKHMELTTHFNELINQYSNQISCIFKKEKDPYGMNLGYVEHADSCVDEYSTVFKHPLKNARKKGIVCSFLSEHSSHFNDDITETCICSALVKTNYVKSNPVRCVCRAGSDCSFMNECTKSRSKRCQCSNIVSRKLFPDSLKVHVGMPQKEAYIGITRSIRSKLDLERKLSRIIKLKRPQKRISYGSKEHYNYMNKRAIDLQSLSKRSLNNSSTATSVSIVPTASSTSTSSTTKTTVRNDDNRIVTSGRSRGYNIAIGLSALSIIIIVTLSICFLFGWYNKKKKEKYVNRRRIRPPRISEERRGNYRR